MAGINLAGSGQILDLEKMDVDNSVTLALKKIDRKNQTVDSSVRELVEECLDCLPLAIVQAAAFIGFTGMTVDCYIRLYRGSENNAIDLLSEEFEDLARDASRANAVARSWDISFDQIKRQDQRATDLLSFMACLHHQAIPKSLLPKEKDKDLAFEKSLGFLKAFALISENSDHQEIDMHRLVHLAVRRRLRAAGVEIKWAMKALLQVALLYPTGEESAGKICAKYLPHALAVLVYKTASQDLKLSRARLLHNVGVYYEKQGKYSKSTQFLGEATSLRENLLGPHDAKTLSSKQQQAWALLRHGNYEAAEGVCQQSLRGRQSAYGEEHPETLECRNLLADIYRRRCKYVEAEYIYRKIMPIAERVHGRESHFTLACKFNFGVVLEVQGRFREAEKLIREVVEGREKLHGKEDPAVFDTISRVGAILNRRGRFGEAEHLHRSLLERRKKVLGEHHPDILISMRNIAVSLREQGNQQEAEQLFRYVLDRRKETLGSDHPYTLGIAYNLARSLYLQGDLSKAEEMLARVCQSQEDSLGFLHQDTLLSLRQLGQVYERQGQAEKAEKVYRRVIAGSEEVFGQRHLDTLGAMHDLARMLCMQGLFHWADEFTSRLLKEADVVKEERALLSNVIGLAKDLSTKSQHHLATSLYRVTIEALDDSTLQDSRLLEIVRREHELTLRRPEKQKPRRTKTRNLVSIFVFRRNRREK
jgi:tetratricopeptide (TPR) repeat protein